MKNNRKVKILLAKAGERNFNNDIYPVDITSEVLIPDDIRGHKEIEEYINENLIYGVNGEIKNSHMEGDILVIDEFVWKSFNIKSAQKEREIETAKEQENINKFVKSEIPRNKKVEIVLDFFALSDSEKGEVMEIISAQYYNIVNQSIIKIEKQFKEFQVRQKNNSSETKP